MRRYFDPRARSLVDQSKRLIHLTINSTTSRAVMVASAMVNIMSLSASIISFLLLFLFISLIVFGFSFAEDSIKLRCVFFSIWYWSWSTTLARHILLLIV